jgi:hypothetical protein
MLRSNRLTEKGHWTSKLFIFLPDPKTFAQPNQWYYGLRHAKTLMAFAEINEYVSGLVVSNYKEMFPLNQLPPFGGVDVARMACPFGTLFRRKAWRLPPAPTDSGLCRLSLE